MNGALLAVLLAVPPAFAQSSSTATLRGIDVWRSTVVTSDSARARFGAKLNEYVNLRNGRRPAMDEKAEDLRRGIEKDLRETPGVAWASVRVTEYFTSVDHAMYATFDVVDRSDVSRLAFAPEPKGTVLDPGGLLAAWREYSTKGEALARAGEISFERPDCPGYYCLWGGKPELDEAQKRFVEGSAKRATELHQVLEGDADAEKRTDALFVLSYSAVGRDVAGACHEALGDSDARVRGAALQILADIANHHPDVPIALDRVLPRLDDPSSSVRAKALGLLVPLADRPGYRPVALSAAPRLASMLKLSSPESRDLAFTVLGMMSKKPFDRRDFAAWDSWAEKAAAGKP